MGTPWLLEFEHKAEVKVDSLDEKSLALSCPSGWVATSPKHCHNGVWWNRAYGRSLLGN